jgi:hypothetical protein
MADQKLSELAATTAVGPTDLLYVVVGGVSRRVTWSSLLSSVTAPMMQNSIATTDAGSSNVASVVGVSDPFFVMDRSRYHSAIFDVVAEDIDALGNYSIGQIQLHWVTSNVVALHTATLTQAGTNLIGFAATTGSGTTVRIGMTRTENTGNTVAIRWSVRLFNV